MSATADATHFAGCKGTIRLEGCRFEAMGDDGANIKSGLYLSLKQKVDDHTILAQHNLKMVDSPDPGDIMEVSHADDLIPYASIRVKKVELPPNDGLQRIEFEDPLPNALKEGDVFGNATRTPKARITNCVVRNNRARGMLIQTRDVIVENCRFEGCTGPGIMVLTEVTYFFESIGTRDVTVRNCLFENCNYGAAAGPGALCAMAYLANLSYPPKPGVHKNVVFERNTIRRCDNSAIFAAGVDGITIRRNRIEGACADPTADIGRIERQQEFIRSSRTKRYRSEKAGVRVRKSAWFGRKRRPYERSGLSESVTARVSGAAAGLIRLILARILTQSAISTSGVSRTLGLRLLYFRK